MKILINGQTSSVLKLANALIAAEGTASDRTLKPHDVYAFFRSYKCKIRFYRKKMISRGRKYLFSVAFLSMHFYRLPAILQMPRVLRLYITGAVG